MLKISQGIDTYTCTRENVTHIFRYPHSLIRYGKRQVLTMSDRPFYPEGHILIVIIDEKGQESARFFESFDSYTDYIKTLGGTFTQAQHIDDLKQGASPVSQTD